MDRRRVGIVVAWLSPVLAVVTWWFSGDAFPPTISLSQYGIGPWGWLFTCWALTFAIAVMLLYRVFPAPARLTTWFAMTGAAGAVVMGAVRTDRGGAQHSFHAKVHMTGSILALVGLPIATWLTLRVLGPWWRRWSGALVLISAVSLVLLVAAAFGWDSLGLGQARTWAFWQLIAVLADQALLAGLAVAAWRSGSTRLWKNPSRNNCG